MTGKPPGGALDGVVAGVTAITSIESGVLRYRGYRIEDLAANATFEEVAYLLWNGDLPSDSDLRSLRPELTAACPTPEQVDGILAATAKQAPMEVLRSAASLLSAPAIEQDLETSDREAARILAVGLPVVVASAHRRGMSTRARDPQSGIAENFLWMLRGARPSPVEARAIEAALIVHADHELNASTFAARVTAATLSDMYSAVTSALGALKGPLHGAAAEGVLVMLREIGKPGVAERWLDTMADAGKPVPGFGHAVYRQGDPRAAILKEMCHALVAEQGDDDGVLATAARVEQLMLARSGLRANVDFYSAPCYHLLGIPREIFAPVFAIGRVVGWAAHVMEQHVNNRLIRPRAHYIGPPPREWRPLEQRL
ncbi:MAG: citrate synthase [Dehalococcoidia bacterium]|nr:citrate synthase [Dehalococcoidia bacterium]